MDLGQEKMEGGFFMGGKGCSELLGGGGGGLWAGEAFSEKGRRGLSGGGGVLGRRGGGRES